MRLTTLPVVFEPGLYQSFRMPPLDQNGLNLLHAGNADTVSELYQTGWIENLTPLKVGKAAKALPVGIFVKFFNCPFVAAIVTVFQNAEADHEPNGFTSAAQCAIVI